MTPEQRSEIQFMSICDALGRTQATLRNGLVAASLPDLLNGVYHMTRHTRIDGGADRHVEVAFKLRSFGSVHQCRIGATVAAQLMTDAELSPWLTQSSKPPPWHTHTAVWKAFLTFQLQLAEDFIALHEQSYAVLTGRPSPWPSNYIENIELNRRKFNDKYNSLNLGVKDNA